MSAPLYTLDILRLAASLGGQPRLTHPQATEERRSATCGSRVTVDLSLDAQGRVAEFGQDARACALGQAAAAILGAHIVGRNAAELAEARDRLAAFLGGARDDPGDWPGIAVLAAARDYP
ncbi:MAG: iron-sulfur cluster assembly scaffold protein, partial [Sphingomonadaceae bacterium]|nr:iron-sulfur cluster assembly scaffold protein [Sphingomonadaceae bacterium]